MFIQSLPERLRKVLVQHVDGARRKAIPDYGDQSRREAHAKIVAVELADTMIVVQFEKTALLAQENDALTAERRLQQVGHLLGDYLNGPLDAVAPEEIDKLVGIQVSDEAALSLLRLNSENKQ